MAKKSWHERTFVLKQVNRKGEYLKFASEELKDDKQIVMKAIDNYKNSYQSGLEYASKRLKNDSEVVLKAVKKSASAFDYASEQLKDDETIVLAAIEHGHEYFDYASIRLKSNRSFIFQAIKVNLNIVKYCPAKITNDYEIMKLVLSKLPRHIDIAGPALTESREIAEIVCTQEFDRIVYFHPSIQNDLNLVKSILNKISLMPPIERHNFQSNKFSSIYFEDKELLTLMFSILTHDSSKNISFLHYVKDEDFLDDLELALLVVKSKPFDLAYLSDRLKNHKEVALRALENDIRVFRHIGDNLKEDIDFLSQAVAVQPNIFRDFPMHLKNNYQLFQIAVEHNEYLLSDEDVNPDFKKRREIMLVRLKSGDISYHRLRKDLREDETFFFEGLRILKTRSDLWRLREIIEAAPAHFFENKEIAIKSVDLVSDIYQYLSDDLKQDKDIVDNLFKHDARAFEHLTHEKRSDLKLINQIIILFKNSERIDTSDFVDHFEKHIPDELLGDMDLALKLLSFPASKLLSRLPDKFKTNVTFITKVNSFIENKSDSRRRYSWSEYTKSDLYNFASKEIKALSSIAKTLLNDSKSEAAEIIKLAPASIKNNKEIVELALKNDVTVFKHLSIGFRNDINIVNQVIDKEIELLVYAGDNIKFDKTFVLRLVQNQKISTDDFRKIYEDYFSKDLEFIIELANITPEFALLYELKSEEPKSLPITFGLEICQALIKIPSYTLSKYPMWKFRLYGEVLKNLSFDLLDDFNWKSHSDALIYFLNHVDNDARLAIPLKKNILEWSIATRKIELIRTFLEREILSKTILKAYSERLSDLSDASVNSLLMDANLLSMAPTYTFNEKDRNKILNDLKEKGKLSKKYRQLLDKYYTDDYDIVYEMVAIEPEFYRELNKTLKEDFAIAKRTIELHPINLKVAPNSILNIKEFLMSALSRESSLYSVYAKLNDDLKLDEEVTLLALSQEKVETSTGSYLWWKHNYNVTNVSVLDNLPNEFLTDLDFAIKAVSIMPQAYKHFNEAIQKDIDVIFAAVKGDGSILFDLDESYLENHRLIKAAIQSKANVYKSLSLDLRKEEDIILTAVESDIKMLEAIPKSLTASTEFYDKLAHVIVHSKKDVSKLKNARTNINLVKALLRNPKYQYQMKLDTKLLEDTEVKEILEKDFIPTEQQGLLKRSVFWEDLINRLNNSGFLVIVKFPNNRMYHYNSEFYLWPSDRVTVTGKIADIGVVQKIYFGTSGADYMQKVSRIVTSAATQNYTMKKLIERLRDDHLFILELLAITEDTAYMGSHESILKELNLDKKFWENVSKASSLQKKFLKLIIQKNKTFFDEEFSHHAVIKNLL